MSKVAILGVGKVGTAIARAAVAAGHEVTIAGSGPAAPVEFIAEVMAPGAAAATAAAAVQGAEIVVLAIPLPKLASLDPQLLAGHVVIDAMNHWEPTDGALPAMFDGATHTSGVVAAHLPGARVVKALNHIGYHEMTDDARPAEAADRRGLAAVSDDPEAADIAATFVGSFGFDVVAAGPLSLGVRLEPGTEIFADRYSVSEIRDRLHAVHV